MKTAIIVDSAAGLDDKLLNHPDVYPLLLSLNLPNGETMLDTNDAQLLSSFYTELNQMSTLPTTSQPAYGTYLELMESLVTKGYERVFCVHLSSGISGTYQTACMVAQEFSDSLQVQVIDSKAASVIMAQLVRELLQWIEADIDTDRIVARAQWCVEHAKIYLSVSDMKNLAKGGRISSATALLGGMLQIRPLLMFDNGQIVLFEKIRTDKKVVKRLVGIAEEWIMSKTGKVFFAEADALNEMYQLRETIGEESIPIEALSAAIGVHTGAGTKAIAFFPFLPEGM